MSARERQPAISTTLQLFVLRTVLISTIVAAVLSVLFVFPDPYSSKVEVAPWYRWFWLSTLLFTLMHHVGSTFGPKRFPIRRWMDIPLTFLELACNWYHSALVLKYVRATRSYSSVWSTQDTITLLFQWTVALSLTLWLVLKATDVLVIPSRRWSDKVDVAHLTLDPWWAYPIFAIFGRKLWSPTLPGESGWISIARGVLSLSAFATILVFGVYQVLVAPYVEISATPHREFRVPSASTTAVELLVKGNWSVIVVWAYEGTQKTMPSTVEVKWAFEAPYTGDAPPCRTASVSGRCDGRGTYSSDLCLQARPDRSLCAEETSWPFLEAIHVRINFTDMYPLDVYSRSDPAAEINAAHVYVGLDHYDAVRPIRVFPGTHLLTIVDHIIRRRLKSQALATLGYETHEETIIFEPVYTISNPLANETDPNIATLTITMERFDKGEWVVNEDFRNKSVLDGLSDVGGLGSIFSTLLVLLLGTSLMGALLRTKDASPLGLLHHGMNDKLIRACKEEYPELQADIARFREHPGLVVYLLDTLVSLGPLEHLEGDGHKGGEHERLASFEDDVESVDIPLKSKTVGTC